MPEEISCPAAASVFGVAPLPEGLASGRGLKGFGIVQEDETGGAMFRGDDPSSCRPGRPHRARARRRTCGSVPDVVVAEGPVESLMWLLLADLNLARGQRRTGETAVLQATCVDATLIPYCGGAAQLLPGLLRLSGSHRHGSGRSGDRLSREHAGGYLSHGGVPGREGHTQVEVQDRPWHGSASVREELDPTWHDAVEAGPFEKGGTDIMTDNMAESRAGNRQSFSPRL